MADEGGAQRAAGAARPSTCRLHRLRSRAAHHLACIMVTMALACAGPAARAWVSAPSRRTQRQRVAPSAQGSSGSGGEQPDDAQQQPQPPPAAAAAATPPPPLNDPAQMVVWGGRLPPTRRLVTSAVTASAIGRSAGRTGGVGHTQCRQRRQQAGGALPHTAPSAPHRCRCLAALGANFLGVTSWLLSLDGGRLAEQTRLDVLVPGGWRSSGEGRAARCLLCAARSAPPRRTPAADPARRPQPRRPQ